MRLRIFKLVALAVVMSGCAITPAPIIDMEGVDLVKHNRDLADCYRNVPTVGAGNPISKCMAAKNYRILYGF